MGPGGRRIKRQAPDQLRKEILRDYHYRTRAYAIGNGSASPGSGAVNAPRITCRSCGGWQHRGNGDGHPYGWYQLSVSVPSGHGKDGRAYVWVGTFCSARCVASFSVTELPEQERLAHTGYVPDLPVTGRKL